jgi:hypothetical protein
VDAQEPFRVRLPQQTLRLMPSSIAYFGDFLASADKANVRSGGWHCGSGAPVRVRNGRGTGTLSASKLLKDIAMNKMNPVDTGIHPIGRESERHRLSVLLITAALALFVGGGMVLYSF